MQTPPPNFDLTLKVQKSFFEDIEILEEIEEERILKVIFSNILINDYKNFNNNNNNKKGNKKGIPPFETEKAHLINIYNNIENNKNKVNLKKTRPFGRVYPEKYNSLINIRNEIRQILTYDKYIDIDLKNCFPSLVYNLCKNLDYQTPKLAEYVENVEEKKKYYNNLFNTEHAKKLFIRILHNGDFAGWARDFKINKNYIPDLYLNDYMDEMKEIILFLKNKYPDIWDYINTQKKDHNNKDGSFIACIIQELERKILEHTYIFLKNKYNIEPSALCYCYDGFLLKKEYYKNDLLKEINKYILDTFNFKIYFEIKEIKEEYYKKIENITIPPDELEILKNNKVEAKRGVITNLFINKIKYILSSLNSEFFENFNDWINIGCLLSKLNNKLDNEAKNIFKKFSEQSKTWDIRHKINFDYNWEFIEKNKHKNKFTLKKLFEIAGEEIFKIDYLDVLNEIYETVSDNVIIEPVASGEKFLYKTFNNNINYWEEGKNFFNSYISDLIIKIADTYEDKKLRSVKFIKDVRDELTLKISTKYDKYKIFNNNSHLLPFKNGVVDLLTSEFRKAKKSDLISQYIHYDFKYIDKEKILNSETYEMISKIFVNEEIREYALNCYGTCLIGQNIQFIFCTSGTGGNGKSCLHRFLKNALSTFAIEGNDAILSESTKAGPTQELASLNLKRFAIFSEPNRKKPFNNEILKKLTGGSDIVGRALYSDITNLKNHMSLFIEANELPAFSSKPGPAEFRRLQKINFYSEFRAVYEDDYKNMRFKANNKYDSPKWHEENRLHLINLLLPYAKKYLETEKIEQPDIIKEDIKKYFISCDNISEWLINKLIYNPSIIKNDSIKIKEIYDDHYKTSKIYNLQYSRDKRTDNFKKFVSELLKDLHFSKFITKNSNDSWVINNHRLKTDDEKNEEEEEEQNEEN